MTRHRLRSANHRSRHRTKGDLHARAFPTQPYPRPLPPPPLANRATPPPPLRASMPSCLRAFLQNQTHHTPSHTLPSPFFSSPPPFFQPNKPTDPPPYY